jgi:hypothetical protein
VDGFLPFALINAAGIAAFAVGYACARLGRRWALVGAGAVLALLLLKCVLSWMPTWEAALFPGPWYIYLQGYWIMLVGLLFFGLAVPQLPVRWNRWAVVAIAAGVALWGADRTRWIVQPEHHGREVYADANHHCEQSTPYTCAPTSCVCALSYVGVRVSEVEMARDCLTRETGTTVFNTFRGLVIALAGSPYRPRLVHASPEELSRPGVVAVIDDPGIRHALAAYGLGGTIRVHDPLIAAPRDTTLEAFRPHYGGVAILIEPR